MSSVEATQNKENVTGGKASQKVPATKHSTKGPNTSGTRKPLNAINGFQHKNSVHIFEDVKKETLAKLPVKTAKAHSKSPTKNQAATQTQLTGSDLTEFQNMVSPDVQHYKDLAEARREALNESLKENEELFIEKEEYKEKVDYLEKRVLSLEETVEKARKITEMIEPYLNSNEDDEDDIRLSDTRNRKALVALVSAFKNILSVITDST